MPERETDSQEAIGSRSPEVVASWWSIGRRSKSASKCARWKPKTGLPRVYFAAVAGIRVRLACAGARRHALDSRVCGGKPAAQVYRSTR